MAWDFQTLFRQHAQGIARSLTRRGFSPDVAADLTQDTFLRVMRADPAITAADHTTRAYLYTVARNLGLNHLRRQRLTATLPLDTPEAERAAAQAADAAAIVADRQQLRLVAAALMDMPARQRRAFLLHRIEGRPIARVAEDIGLSTTRTWELVRDAYRRIVLRSGGL